MKLSIRAKQDIHRLEVVLKDNSTLRLGRSDDCDIVVGWDIAISRKHAELQCRNGKLHVTCLELARNPFRYQKKYLREATLSSGQCFQIGTTIFQFSGESAEELDESSITAREAVPKPLPQPLTKTNDDVERVAFRNTEQQLMLLSQLPALIASAKTDADLGESLCSLLMEAIPQADAVAVGQYDFEQLPESPDNVEDFPEPLMLRVRAREGVADSFSASRRIVVRALREQKSVLHIWYDDMADSPFTISAGLDWAICSPVRAESCRGWCMYVSGHGTRANSVYVSEADLESDVRFTELVAQFIGSVRQVRLLQDERSRLNSFFSPQVIDSLTTGSKSRSLEPAEREITVLFCDVRGFSKKAERFKDDLLGLLGSVRAALGIMVDGILEQDGTIADFQGDAALGFWGWPVELKYGPIPACRAALAIQKKFEEASRSSELMDTFSVGIGIAHGRAVAGQIGTDQQSKIGVFGPVVNQCARLESMTKQFGVSICVDGRTAEFIDRYLSESDARLRPLAKVRPRGMDVALDVFNLLPSESEFPEVTAQVIKDHSAAWEAVVDGRWSEAIEALDRVPDDGPKSFLIRQMAAFGNKAPDNWTGAFSLLEK